MLINLIFHHHTSQHILSFLPTKDAVATCILSKRWKFLWTSVPNIDFDDALLYTSEMNGWFPLEVSCFMNFVERVLLLRDASAMKKFRLSCRVCFSASRVHAWISAAVMHNIQELDLCLFVEKPFMLPLCVFDSKSLTVLKIEMNCVLELPTCISFPSLRILHLCLVTFLNDYSIHKLFSSCPVLQELAILDCEWMNLKSVAISIPTLKSLTIDDLPYFGSDDMNGCQIKINTANLTLLNYIGYLCNELFLCNVPSLVKAYIHVPVLSERLKEVGYRIVKLLKGLEKVNSVKISTRTIESLFSADNVLDRFPLFQNLTCLELSMKIKNQTVVPLALMELLRCSPNLQSLHFTEGLDLCICFRENDLTSMPVPKCLLSCMKIVSFQNFHGHETEICFLKYFLENALVLERMNIFLSKNTSGHLKNQREVKTQLQMLDRGSKDCVITFS